MKQTIKRGESCKSGRRCHIMLQSAPFILLNSSSRSCICTGSLYTCSFIGLGYSWGHTKKKNKKKTFTHTLYSWEKCSTDEFWLEFSLSCFCLRGEPLEARRRGWNRKDKNPAECRWQCGVCQADKWEPQVLREGCRLTSCLVNLVFGVVWLRCSSILQRPHRWFKSADTISPLYLK